MTYLGLNTIVIDRIPYAKLAVTVSPCSLARETSATNAAVNISAGIVE